MTSNMKSSANKIKMTSIDDLFGTSSRNNSQENHNEQVKEIPLIELYPFKNHPYKVLEDETMTDTVESISKYGVLVPAIARPRPEGGYELISGHRRKRGSELAGKETMPVVVRSLDDDEATIIMVDSNIQRENLLPSEKAWAYKMRLDAIRRKAGRPTKDNSRQVGENITSVENISETSEDSARNIHRYIRLTELIPALLEMADTKKLAFNAAVSLSYLKQDEQEMLLEVINDIDSIPTLVQAERLKSQSNAQMLDKNVAYLILTENEVQPKQITLKEKHLKKYFHAEYNQKQIEDIIVQLLEEWSGKQK